MDDLIKELQIVSEEQREISNRISQAIADEKNRLESLQERDRELRSRLLEAMEISIANGGSNVFQNDVLKINYIAPQIRTTLDTSRIKSEAPEVFKEFSKEVEVKSHLKIDVYEKD